MLITEVPRAQEAYTAGRLETPAAAAQAWRPVTVAGAEQLTALLRFKDTKHEALLRVVVPAVQLAYAAGRLETPAAATQA